MNPKSLVLLATFGLAIPLVGQAKIQRDVEKFFTVSPGVLVRVTTQGGNIQVRVGSSDNTVKIIAHEHFRTDSEQEADELAKQLTLDLAQSGREVSATAKVEGSRGWSLWNSGNRVSVDFEVFTPARTDARLKTSGGNIGVGDLSGEVTAQTSGGNIEVGKIDGELDLHTSGGSISIREARRNVSANTSGGDVRVEVAKGDVKLSTSGGNIRVGAVIGKVSAKTSGGDISATFADRLAGDSDLRTSGGNVTVRIGGKAALHLDAQTSGGAVRLHGLDAAVTDGGNGKSKLVGNIGGGGADLVLRTSGGDVRVEAN